jgi:hypothetical protein
VRLTLIGCRGAYAVGAVRTRHTRNRPRDWDQLPGRFHSATVIAVVLGVWVSAWAANTSVVGAAGTGTALTPWTAPELIPAIPATTIDESRPNSPLTAPAFDATGDAVIVWTTETAAPTRTALPEYSVRAAVRPADGHWQPGETLSRAGLNPQVTVDARGDAIAAWEGRLGVEAAIKPVGGSWLAPQTVGTPRGDEPQEPQVASDASGDAIVVAPVQEHGQESTGIEVALRPAGGTFSPPQSISRHRELALDPRIAMNARGDAIVVWDVQVHHTACLLRAAFRSAGGGWGAPSTVPNGHEYCRGTHDVAIDERGDALVAWAAMRGSTSLVETAWRGANGRWSAQPVTKRASPVAEPPWPQGVGMDARGDAIVVWVDPTGVGGRRTIWARIRPVGRGWGTEEQIAAVPYESSPSFAMGARGDAVVVWGDKRGIEVALHPAGRRWQTPHTVLVGTRAQIAFDARPIVALDAHGEGVVAWESNKDIETAWHTSLFP